MIDPVTSAPCVVCGATHSQCGQGADVVPVDIPTLEVKPVKELRELRLYEVVVNGYTTNMKLNKADAERMGGKEVERVEQADDAESTQDETTESTQDDDAAVKSKARRRTANRARGAEDDK